MTALELNTLKTSSCGRTLTLPIVIDFVTRKSSWLIRSVNWPFELYGIN